MQNKFQERTAALIKRIPDEYDGALITSEVNGYYLTGFKCDNFLFVASREGCFYITDSRYSEAAGKHIEWCRVIEYKNLKKSVGDALQGLNIDRLMVELSRVTLNQYAALSEAFSPAKLSNEGDLDGIINSLRVHKDSDEIKLMQAAQAIAEQSLKYVFGLIREGVSEKELAFEFEFHARRLGAEKLAFDSIVASGENGSMPHAVPSERRLKKGDLITFDVGAVVGGYHSDMTRTVALGSVSQEQRKVYDTVLEAQQSAMDYLTSGGCDLAECDAAARDVISAAGYGEYFGHSTGHGVGLEIHEFPAVASRHGDIPTGAVITVEPGIYIPGKFGVRIENMMWKTEDSAVNLTNLPRELIEL